MTIVLTYTKEEHTQEQVGFEDDSTEIELAERGIISIDLSPLAACVTLLKLGLNQSQLHSRDAIHSWLRQEQAVLDDL